MNIFGGHRPSYRSIAIFASAFVASTALARPASAAPVNVACVGEQTTHSDQLQRPVEYPAMLQTKLGAGYNVTNFGDCCCTAMYGYPKQGETHPYLSGQMGVTPLDPAGMPLTPGYQLGTAPSYMQSIVSAPDVVVIGSWGKHDTEIANALYSGKLDATKWQADYDRLVATYVNLSSKPKVYVSTPLPIPSGQPIGVTTTVILPAIEAVAAKYHLTIVPLYQAFLNQPQLYKDSTHPTNGPGLQMIADTVYATMTGAQPPSGDGGSDDAAGGSDGSATADATTVDTDGGAAGDAGAVLDAGGSPNPPGGGDAGGSTVGANPGGGPPMNSSGCACVVASSERGSGTPAGLLAVAAAWLLAGRRRGGARSRS
jgi:hypothetical protein